MNILFLISSLYASSQEIVQNLADSAEFRYKGKWYPAKIPGNIYLDLFKNGLIPDPFYADNENKLQWVADSAWTYRFHVVPKYNLFKLGNIDLVLNGIDPFARVWLNNEFVLESDNMFTEQRAQVGKLLRENNNNAIIKIEFVPLSQRARLLSGRIPYTLPGEEKVFARKAQFQWGWDFAPKFIAGGSIKNISLQGYNARIISVRHSQKLYKDSAIVLFDVECIASRDMKAEISAGLIASNPIKREVELKKSRPEIVQFRYKIKDPKLWWCNGGSESQKNPRMNNLYNFRIRLKNGMNWDEKEVSIGLRKFELKHDSDENGKGFTFYINDHPVFIKGANYVPQDVFLARTSPEDYHKIVEAAAEKNINMLRVWGGGVYPDDEFYSACDAAGVFVWQDFMFACSMYPGDSAFLNNLKQEVKEQVLRLANHPCLALWCGNNESIEGWYNWGWQKQYNYSKKDSTEIVGNYKKLFHELIPQTIKENSSDFNYWPSSPEFGWGRKESLKYGDCHYWGVWWGEEPFKKYEEKIGRFMSEYGFQSYPALSTVKKFCDVNVPDPALSGFQNHQKHQKGFQIISDYMARDFRAPVSLEENIYVTQLLQLKGMETAIEAHRRAKPYCMGTMFWQLNDCWPGITWSALDYYKTPKAFFYHLERLYDNILLSVQEDSTDWKIFIVSENESAQKGVLTVNVKTVNDAQKIPYAKREVTIEANSSHSYLSIKKSDLLKSSPRKIYFRCELNIGGKTFRKLYFLSPPKDLMLAPGEIKYIYDAKYKSVKISSAVFQKNVFISINDGATLLSDNFFDLEAGETREIQILSPNFDMRTVKILSLNNLKYKD